MPKGIYTRKEKKNPLHNRIAIGNKYCIMDLYKGYGFENIIGHTIFDKEFLPLIKNSRWRIDGRGYVGNHKIKLHQLIIGKKIGFETDHLNGDKMDNRIKNLKLVTHAQNNWNKKYRGVHRHSQTRNWVVQIKANGIHHHIGCFKSFKEAIEARKLAEIKYRK